MPRKLTQEEFIERARQVHGDKYDYSKAGYISTDTKICIICPEHGEFWQTPSNHLKGQGCPKCAGKFRYKTSDFIAAAEKAHGGKYDYSKVSYISNKTKICIICPEHGEFWQTPDTHLNRKSGCPKCARIAAGNLKRSSPERFAAIASKVHGGKYDYSESGFATYRAGKVKIICPEHGEFWQDPKSHLRGCGCPRCRDSRGERAVAAELARSSIAPERNRRFKELGDLSYDFYIPSRNLLIEYNGEQHYSQSSFGRHNLKKQRHHDWLKRKYARDHSIRLLAIPYWDFGRIPELVKEALES